MAPSAKQFRPCLQKGDNSWQETHNSVILQQTISGSQTHETVATSDGFKYVKQPFACTNFQVETAESIRKSIRKGEWVTSIDLTDAYFHVPIHPQSQKYLRFQTRKGVFQFQALLFWCRNSSPRVYLHCERGKTHSSSQEPQNP